MVKILVKVLGLSDKSQKVRVVVDPGIQANLYICSSSCCCCCGGNDNDDSSVRTYFISDPVSERLARSEEA